MPRRLSSILRPTAHLLPCTTCCLNIRRFAYPRQSHSLAMAIMSQRVRRSLPNGISGRGDAKIWLRPDHERLYSSHQRPAIESRCELRGELYVIWQETLDSFLQLRRHCRTSCMCFLDMHRYFVCVPRQPTTINSYTTGHLFSDFQTRTTHLNGG